MAPSVTRRNLVRKLLFVYQMPKTGSQTVEATLRTCALPHQILRFHYLSAQRAEEIARGPEWNIAPGKWQHAGGEELKAMAQVSRLIRGRKLLRYCLLPVPRIDVISAVREPIGAALSSIFENYFYFFPDLASMTPEVCAEIVQRPRLINSYQNWFEVETRSILGIDVYQHEFPRDQGFAICQNRVFRLLVFRFEALNRLPAMLQAFLGCDVKTISTVNLSESKPYAKIYDETRRKLCLPPDFVCAQYSSKMMRHFYSLAELDEMKQRWLTPSAEIASLTSGAQTGSLCGDTASAGFRA
jgi:hypothetical protein